MSQYSEVELLTKDHDRNQFQCGEGVLDKWLREQARQANSKDLSRTFVVCHLKLTVVGFYTLVAGEVDQFDTPHALRKGAAERPIPIVTLARLAVDKDHQGKGLGAALLKNAMQRVVSASDSIGIRAMIVHAKDEAVAEWYSRFDFEQSPTDPLHLFLSVQDIRDAFGHTVDRDSYND